MARPGGAARTALVLVAVLAAAACAPDSRRGSTGRADPRLGEAPAANSATRRPVVEVPTAAGALPFLDAGADPGTALGRLRARYLPVWTPDFDWAFPPEACDTAWELDGIAEPAAAVDVAMLGDFATAAALSVMRYEHQFSRALAEPSPLAQLCVAATSVEPARSDALSVLGSHLATGARRSEPAAYPDEVWILAVSPTSVVSVACVMPGYPAVVADDGRMIEASRSPSRLQAYLLTVSRGLEDRVADVSYRVSNATHRPAEDCGGLDAWALEWDGHVQDWMAEGQIWEPLGAILTAEGICNSPPPDGPSECPKDWLL